ncbi:hypothetical protein CTA1_11737 [Colletotrichum tanaceti]|uniref:Uncharacterized protein n=1 Tax=Colletotrichum tanaceti TaxID=1306861 RepID=A0A4V6DHA1_9PEZI|nr:hypothetical protein CTA1_11737 [Colletotrichum tanaceti]
MSERERKDLAVYSGTSLRPDTPEWGYGDGDKFPLHETRHVKAFATSSEVTHCIWYPDVATEDTYREVVRRYPEMRYQVGRACAVAGYKTLLDELDLLPDVSIAEEARDNGHTDIFEAIVAQPVRYAVMNDYTRSVDLQNPRPGACLTGDAAVRSSLQPHATAEEVEAASKEESALRRWPDHYFDIQEDANAVPIPNEITAVVRGAYHHTPFARWLETCVDEIFPRGNDNTTIRQAFHARFIMNDDLSRIDSEIHGETLPESFWWPHCPHEETLRELAWRQPNFKHQVTLACIARNYRHLFLKISNGMKPTQQQYDAATGSPNKFYREHIEQRAKDKGVQLSQ